ncbi:MAG: signal peptide peptidase SppA [Candidatus Margulisbacteria bacterium]|nr:signal peptide peptidase SppA [Candidatus Margulisiibacteriota bacterium]
MKKILIIFILLLATSAQANWIEEAVREPMGIRAAGMGGAFTSVADDASAIFYNPAGLADPGSQYQSGIMDNNGALNDLSAYSVFNFGPIAYSEKRIVSLTNQKAYIYSYAFSQRGNNGVNWGLSYKRILEQSDENSSAQGWAVDLGLLFKMTPKTNIGLLAQNISAGAIDLIPNYRLGGSINWADVLWSVDADYQNVSPYRHVRTEMHYGLEKEITNGLALRLGTDNKIGTAGFSIGLGFAIFEYATWSTSPQTYRFGFKLGQDKFRESKDRSFALFKAKDFVEIELQGNLISGRDEFSLIQGFQQGADVIREQITMARQDDEVGGIVLRIGNIESNLAMFGTIQEIREELLLFKEEGKKIIVYLESGADYANYYLASVADKIITPPAGGVGLFGLSASPMYLSKLFENIGIKWKIISAGKYKTAFNPMQEGMPEEAKQHLITYIENLNQQVLTDIAKARKIDLATIAQLKTGRIYTAKNAKDLGLIDEIGYYEDAKEFVKEVSGEKFEPQIIKTAVLEETGGPLDFSYLWPWPGKIAIVDIDGAIVIGKSNRDFLFGSKTVGADDVCAEIDKVAEDPLVKAIIVRINSPGGSAIAADQIYGKLLKVRENKKKVIVASLGDVAASGGYYIACAADKIISNKGTLAGSIGVYSMFPIYYGLLEKIEIKQETIKTGESVDMLSGLRDITEAEEAMLKESMDEVHTRFILIVAKGRKMQIEAVRPLAQGQIFTGEQSKENGLVDELGNFSVALEEAKKMANLKGEVQLVRFIRVRDFWQQVGYRMGMSLGFDKGIFSEIKPKLMQYRLLY